MSTESISVVWPELCLGCGDKRIGMKDSSFKWRSTEPVGSKVRSIGPLISLKVQVQLCEECAEESKMLRKANSSWNWTIWLMKFFFLLLIPAILIIISTSLVSFIPGVEYTYIPPVLALTYPMVATFITFHDVRMIFLTGSRPASAFITINPPSWGKNSVSFSLRNEDYASLFHQQNPTLESSHTPSIGGDIANPKMFPKKKAIAIVSPSLIAIALIILLVVG